MIARLLALVAALGMVAGAFVYRYGLPGGDGDRTDVAATRAPIVCASELGDDVCNALGDAVTIEPAPVTAKRLLAARNQGDARISGWLAPGPWVDMVEGGRALAAKPSLFALRGERVAVSSTSLVAVTRNGQVIAGCDPTGWKCLGDAAQDPTFRLAGDALSSATGVFLRAAALGGYFGRTGYATNDLDEDVGARPWLDNLNSRLAAAPRFGAGSLRSFVLQQGSARAYLTTAAAARDLPGFDVRAPAPVVKIVVAFTPTLNRGRPIDAATVRKALRAAGWTDAQPKAEDEGLPSPGVLLALSEVGG